MQHEVTRDAFANTHTHIHTHTHMNILDTYPHKYVIQNAGVMKKKILWCKT